MLRLHNVQFVSTFAAYLYDSVKLYAQTLDYLIKAKVKSLNGQPLTAAMIDDIAYNGTLIIQTLINKIEYKSKYKFKHKKYK